MLLTQADQGIHGCCIITLSASSDVDNVWALCAIFKLFFSYESDQECTSDFSICIKWSLWLMIQPLLWHSLASVTSAVHRLGSGFQDKTKQRCIKQEGCLSYAPTSYKAFIILLSLYSHTACFSEAKNIQGQMRRWRKMICLSRICILIKPCLLPWNLVRTTSPPGGELWKKDKTWGTFMHQLQTENFHTAPYWLKYDALDPLNFSANHFPSHIWGMQRHSALRMMQCSVIASW